MVSTRPVLSVLVLTLAVLLGSGVALAREPVPTTPPPDDPLVIDIPVDPGTGDRQQGDRQQDDWQQDDWQQDDMQQGDRQQEDRQQDDRQQEDRQQADRQQEDRQQDDMQQADRQQEDRQQADRQQEDDWQQTDDPIVSEDRQQEDRQQDDRQQADVVVSPDKGKDRAPGYEDLSGVSAEQAVTADQGFDKPGAVVKPISERHGPPGRGPKGKIKWELVDSGDQTGSKEVREALAKEIFGTGIGFSSQDLRAATRGELVDLLLWLNDLEKREAEFAKNLERTGKKLERKKKAMAQMSLGELYKERVGGWFDHQKNADDMKVTLSFKRFLQDRAFGPNAERNNIYVKLLYDIDHLITLAAPAYGVTLAKNDVKRLSVLEPKFKEDNTKGTFQFTATYLMSLLLDRNSLKAAIQQKGYRGRPGKANGDSYSAELPIDLPDQWGKPANAGSDMDLGTGGYGNRGNRNSGGGIDPNTRATMRDLARAGTQIMDANAQYDKNQAQIEQQWQQNQATLNGPAAPGGVENEAGMQRAISDVDTILDQIRARQRQVLDLITRWRQETNATVKANLEANIRGLTYGQSPSQPTADSLLGMLNNQQLKAAMSYASKSGQSQNAAFRSAYARIFGPAGKLDRVQRTQREVISKFLMDRDQDKSKAGAGMPGGAFDPNDPNGPANSGMPGAPGQNGTTAGTNTGSALPANGLGQQATDPNQRIQQINQALQDPNLTPQERQNLQAEQQRLQQQQAAQAAAAQAAAAQAAAVPAGAPAAPTTAAPAKALTEAEAAAKIPQVPNSYGVAPMVCPDSELQAAAAPVIAAEVAKMNQELASKGITVNEFLQYSGKGVTSTGKPAGDHYKMWCDRFPGVKAAMVAAAQAAQARKVKELMAAQPVAQPAVQPVATPTALPSQTGGSSVAGAITEPR
jgi:hypothetical protein